MSDRYTKRDALSAFARLMQATGVDRERIDREHQTPEDTCLTSIPPH